MRIAQSVVAGASEFETKAQRLDYEALSRDHEIVVVPIEELARSGADVAHVYGPAELPRRPFTGLTIPYVASGRPAVRRLAFRHPSEPARIVTPLRENAGVFVPEAVAEAYFDVQRNAPATPVIGSFGRAAVRNMVEQTMARIHRFREDITWEVFDAPPAPAEIASVSLWVDPAIDEGDCDGFVGEAIACGVAVVAARTAINTQRLEKGRTGFLVPPRDPNEMTHAILTALFKPEAATEREHAARQTASKFRVRQRIRALLPLYQNLIR